MVDCVCVAVVKPIFRSGEGCSGSGWSIGLAKIWSKLLLWVATTGAAAAEAPTAVQAMQLAREGAAAAEARDSTTFLARMEAAVALRPDFPRILEGLAAAQLASGRAEDSLATLRRLAAMGVNSPIEKAAEFAALRPQKEFQALMQQLAANLYPRGKGEIMFSLREVTGLIEGIAWRRKTGEFYFGDVNDRAVWRRKSDGTLLRFTPSGDDLLGVFGLAVDEAAGVLWAATNAVPAMRGFTPEQEGTVALAEIDLETGAVRRIFPVGRRPGDEQPHQLQCLAVAADGSVFVTDSGGPRLWHLPAGARALEVFIEDAEFLSLQGIALVSGGVAVLADRANGLLRVDLGTRQVRRFEAPVDTTLVGIGGLAATADGQLIAIQNELRPTRILLIGFDETWQNVTAVKVLESGHVTMAAPSLGCLATDSDFYFIGNSGWPRFQYTEGKPSSPRSVPVFRTRVGPLQR